MNGWIYWLCGRLAGVEGGLHAGAVIGLSITALPSLAVGILLMYDSTQESFNRRSRLCAMSNRRRTLALTFTGVGLVAGLVLFGVIMLASRGRPAPIPTLITFAVVGGVVGLTALAAAGRPRGR
jgi:hypothetical protein